jgi:hypothetical protein
MAKYVNKVTTTVNGVQTILLDVSQTTATDDAVLSGHTYIRADGSEGVGTYVEETTEALQELTTDSEMETFLNNNDAGSYVKFAGTSDVYDTNRIYIIRDKEV